jgi:DNA-binding transcriptional MerR regulator
MPKLIQKEYFTPTSFANLAGVTSRTIRHYEAIGLLAPIARSQSGYRLYKPKQAAKLLRIVALRKLGFSLKEIEGLVNLSAAEMAPHLLARKNAILGEVEGMTQRVTAIDEALATHHDNVNSLLYSINEKLAGQTAEPESPAKT